MRTPTLLLLLGLAMVMLATATDSTRADTPQPALLEDTDMDGIPDFLDSCPNEANVGPIDRDGDLVVDHCDLDPANTGRLIGRASRMGT